MLRDSNFTTFFLETTSAYLLLVYDPKLLTTAYSGAFLGLALTKFLGPPLKMAVGEAFDFLMRVMLMCSRMPISKYYVYILINCRCVA